MEKALKKNIKENKKGRENRNLFHHKYCSCDKFSFILSFSLGENGDNICDYCKFADTHKVF